MVANLLLSGSRRLLLDTNAFIFFLTGQEPFYSILVPVFRRAMNRQATIVASVITESELLVAAERDRDRDAIDRVTDLLSEDGILLVNVESRIARRAAAIRGAALREHHRTSGRTGLFRLPDAIIVATAIETGCEAIVTRDNAFRRVTDIPVLDLDEVARSVSNAPSQKEP